MGPAATTRGGVEAEEVEEVGSDEDDDGFMRDGADVAYWSTRNGTSRRGSEAREQDGGEDGTDDGVCEYDDRALGEGDRALGREVDGTDGIASKGGAGGQGGELEAGRGNRMGLSNGPVVSPGHGATEEARLDANGLRGEGDCARLVDHDGVGAMSRDADKVDGSSRSENSADARQQRRAAQPSSSGVSPVSQIQGGEGLGAASAPETPRNERKGQQPPPQQQHQQQRRGQQNESDDPTGPPPRTPVRPPRAASTSAFGRQTPHAPSAPAAAALSLARHGQWRPSFGSGGEGKVGRSPGNMQAPWAAFSTPLREGGPGWVPPSGCSATGSASVRRKRGGGAGNGPLGRLLQQVLFHAGSFLFACYCLIPLGSEVEGSFAYEHEYPCGPYVSGQRFFFCVAVV